MLKRHALLAAGLLSLTVATAVQASCAGLWAWPAVATVRLSRPTAKRA